MVRCTACGGYVKPTSKHYGNPKTQESYHMRCAAGNCVICKDVVMTKNASKNPIPYYKNKSKSTVYHRNCLESNPSMFDKLGRSVKLNPKKLPASASFESPRAPRAKVKVGNPKITKLDDFLKWWSQGLSWGLISYDGKTLKPPTWKRFADWWLHGFTWGFLKVAKPIGLEKGHSILDYIARRFTWGIVASSKDKTSVLKGYPSERPFQLPKAPKGFPKAPKGFPKMPKMRNPELAMLTPEEDSAWNHAWEYYTNQGYDDDTAGQKAWNDLQQQFPRLREYEGAKADVPGYSPNPEYEYMIYVDVSERDINTALRTINKPKNAENKKILLGILEGTLNINVDYDLEYPNDILGPNIIEPEGTPFVGDITPPPKLPINSRLRVEVDKSQIIDALNEMGRAITDDNINHMVKALRDSAYSMVQADLNDPETLKYRWDPSLAYKLNQLENPPYQGYIMEEIQYKTPEQNYMPFYNDLKDQGFNVGSDAYYEDPDNFVTVIVRDIPGSRLKYLQDTAKRYSAKRKFENPSKTDIQKVPLPELDQAYTSGIFRGQRLDENDMNIIYDEMERKKQITPSAQRLPIVTYQGKRYFVDKRLNELRNVEVPWEAIRPIPHKYNPTQNPQNYSITYFDPEDPEGQRDKTWHFETKEEAEDWREELSVFWDTPKKDIEIHSLEDNPASQYSKKRAKEIAKSERKKGKRARVVPVAGGLWGVFIDGKRETRVRIPKVPKKYKKKAKPRGKGPKKTKAKRKKKVPVESVVKEIKKEMKAPGEEISQTDLAKLISQELNKL